MLVAADASNDRCDSISERERWSGRSEIAGGRAREKAAHVAQQQTAARRGPTHCFDIEIMRPLADGSDGSARCRCCTFVARRYPEVHVDLVTEGSLVDIVADGFDLGLRRADLVPADMIAVPVGRPQRYAVVASPGYLEAHGKPQTPPDLYAHQCIRVRLPNGALFRWHFEKRGQAAQVEVKGPLTLDEASLSRAAVLDAVGIGFFLEQDVRPDIEAKRLTRLLEDWTPPLGDLCL